MFGNNPKAEIKKLRKEISNCTKAFEMFANWNSLMQNLHNQYSSLEETSNKISTDRKNQLQSYEEMASAMVETKDQNDLEQHSAALKCVIENEMLTINNLEQSIEQATTCIENNTKSLETLPSKINELKNKLNHLETKLDEIMG